LKVNVSHQDIEEKIELKSGFRNFIASVIKEEQKKLGEIQFVFTSNRVILEINREFLNHHYFTDVITFPVNRKNLLSGDIYISIEQVHLNAQIYKTSFEEEVMRVIIHGVLHLVGYDDKSEIERNAMREKEDVYLCRFKSMI